MIDEQILHIEIIGLFEAAGGKALLISNCKQIDLGVLDCARQGSIELLRDNLQELWH